MSLACTIDFDRGVLILTPTPNPTAALALLDRVAFVALGGEVERFAFSTLAEVEIVGVGVEGQVSREGQVGTSSVVVRHSLRKYVVVLVYVNANGM